MLELLDTTLFCYGREILALEAKSVMLMYTAIFCVVEEVHT